MDNLENREKRIEKEKSQEFFESNFESKFTPEKESLQEEKNSVSEKQSVVKKQTNEPAKLSRLNPIISKKMKFFLDLAEEKGLSESIKAIKKENDPLLLDSFHDALAKESLFQKFLSKKKKPKTKE